MADNINSLRQDIIDTSKMALGYPVVSLFVTDEQIKKLIDLSVRKCASKACPIFLDTLTVSSSAVDVSTYEIDTIKNVYGSELTGSGVTDSVNVFDVFSNFRMYDELTRGDSNNSMYDRLAYQYSRSEMQKQVLSDWYLDKNTLYLDNYSGSITIEYLKKKISLIDLDSYWLSWVEGYTMALMKITEGRIRSKYKLSSGVFEIEADELINEGTTEKQDLEEKLNENIGYWNILR